MLTVVMARTHQEVFSFDRNFRRKRDKKRPYGQSVLY